MRRKQKTPFLLYLWQFYSKHFMQTKQNKKTPSQSNKLTKNKITKTKSQKKRPIPEIRGKNSRRGHLKRSAEELCGVNSVACARAQSQSPEQQNSRRVYPHGCLSSWLTLVLVSALWTFLWLARRRVGVCLWSFFTVHWGPSCCHCRSFWK